MVARKTSYAALVCLLCSISSLVMAGTFTPEAGTTITSNSVTVGWTSTASEQWVRAYSSNGEKIFDSGRQTSSSGQVNFAVASSETLLRVFFYEKTGDWIANERQYRVAIGNTVGGDTLSDLDCSVNQIARYDGAEWVCSDGLVDILDPTIAAILMRLDALESSIVYSIGDVGPAGGRVFQVSDGGLHGLEAAPEDQDTAQWCSTNSNIVGVDDISLPGGVDATSTATPDPNSGAYNTPLVVAVCGASSAGGIAAAYVWPNGQNDGFLPNADELLLLVSRSSAVGGLSPEFYWSSSEVNEFEAGFYNYYDGMVVPGYKSNQVNVRAVRAF